MVLSLVSFAIDMCIDFHTAFYSHGNLVSDRALIAQRYMHSQFIFDSIAILALLTRSIM